MPWYDLDCKDCGFLEDEPRSVEEREICPLCGGPAMVAITGVNFGGIIFSNAEHSKQLGVTWNSNREKREWMEKNPKVIEMKKGDAADRGLYDRNRAKCEMTAKKLGYRDFQDMRVSQKADIADRKRGGKVDPPKKSPVPQPGKP